MIQDFTYKRDTNYLFDLYLIRHINSLKYFKSQKVIHRNPEAISMLISVDVNMFRIIRGYLETSTPKLNALIENAMTSSATYSGFWKWIINYSRAALINLFRNISQCRFPDSITSQKYVIKSILFKKHILVNVLSHCFGLT